MEQNTYQFNTQAPLGDLMDSGSGALQGEQSGQMVWKTWNYVLLKRPELRNVIDVVRSELPLEKDIFLRFKNRDGDVVNEVSVKGDKNTAFFTLDLDIFVKAASLGLKTVAPSSESLLPQGIQQKSVINKRGEATDYCSLEVHMPLVNSHRVRLVSKDSSSVTSVVGRDFPLSRTAPFHFFVPERQGSSISYGVMNHGSVDMGVQFRLYFDHFYREVVRKIPARGVRVLKIENDFFEVLKSERESTPRFVRISQKSDKQKASVQVIEQQVSAQGVFTFLSVS